MSDYLGDVTFDVWMAGGDVGRINRERVSQNQIAGLAVTEAATIELTSQRRQDTERDLRAWEANEWDLPADERFAR